VKSEDLADVTAQDIKTSTYTLLMDKTRLMTDRTGMVEGVDEREFDRAAGESGLCVSGNV